jgi:protoporphyrinogen oxidase
VVIGGGLSGLAAAVELEKAGIAYTLIEVKRRLGGSTATHPLEGYLMDSGPMLHRVDDRARLHRYLSDVGLADDLFPVTLPDAIYSGFAHGTGALVDALAKRITAPVMKRMAVSTLGQMEAPSGEKRFSICMENGILLDAKALVIAAPARYAERMLHTLVPEAAYLLEGYRYDSIARVSLGYRRADLAHIPAEPPADYPLTTLHHVQHPARVPEGGVLVQAGVRFDPAKGVPADLVGEVAALFDWPQNPQAEHVAYWPEADPVMWVDDTHAATMQRLASLLPPGVALAGNDYLVTQHPPSLDSRLDSGVRAARRVMAALRGG